MGKLTKLCLNNAKKHKSKLIPSFLVISILIIILSSILFVAINPSARLRESRNAQRSLDVNTILNAVSQYLIDDDKILMVIPTGPCTISSANEICKTKAIGTCAKGVDLNFLITEDNNITSFPIDPTVSSVDGTGYYISKSVNNRITVCAPSSEQCKLISVSK